MPTSRALLVALALLAVPATAFPATASLVEDATGGALSYQFDADSHHDAPDACAEAAAEWSAPWGGTTDGLLVPPDDVGDAFVLDLPASAVGRRVTLDVEEAAGPELSVVAYMPGCLTVLDPLAWPTPEPSPPAPGPGEERHEGEGLGDPQRCWDDGWLFVADQVGDPAPATIHVAWTNGQERTVPFTYEPGPHAVYVSHDDLGTTLKGAWINVPAGWTGRLFLAAGPCDAVDGGAVYGEPPALSGGALSFTPVRAGPHVVRVALPPTDGLGLAPLPCATCPLPFVNDALRQVAPTVDTVTSYVHDVAHDPTDPPVLAFPMTCHFCAPPLKEVVEKVSYLLSAGEA